MNKMRLLLAALALTGLAGLTGCSTSKIRAYSGPPITHVYVFKEQRTMVLMSKSQPVATWAVDLGFSPEGHKAQQGDGRTPEGRYYIDRRNPNSAYHLALGISYPDPTDREAARAAGRDPGGDIFIHGEPNAKRASKRDWTAGCIAVKNPDIEEIYAMVRTGTPVSLRA